MRQWQHQSPLLHRAPSLSPSNLASPLESRSSRHVGTLGKSSGDASPLLMARHKQVNSRIRKGSQNILIYNFIITTFDCQGGSQDGGISARAFALARPGTFGAATGQILHW